MIYLDTRKLVLDDLVEINCVNNGLISSDDIFPKGDPAIRIVTPHLHIKDVIAKRAREMLGTDQSGLIILGPHKITCGDEKFIELNQNEKIVVQKGDVFAYDVLSYKLFGIGKQNLIDKSYNNYSAHLIWNQLPYVDSLLTGGSRELHCLPFSFSLFVNAHDFERMKGTNKEKAYILLKNMDSIKEFRKEVFNYLVVGPVQQMGKPHSGIFASEDNGYRFCYLPYVVHEHK